DGPAFFAALPLRIARELRTFKPHAVLAQGAHETAAALSARKLARAHTAVIVDLHGDWRAPTRLYGAQLRGLLSPVADRVALAALDGSTLLVLQSRSEGMGRVIVEAFCRARPVVATRVGGIPDLVQYESNGLLVEPGDTDGLAHALVRILDGRELAERLGAGAHSSAALWTVSPEDFASRLRDLVGRIAGLS